MPDGSRSASDSPARPDASPPRRFVTTQWSVVVAAGQADDADRDAALATLCQNYWYPLYAYVRRRGRNAHDAQELTQELFSQLLDKQWLQAADQEKGRFRAFLLTAFKRFLAREHERANAKTRGGGLQTLSLDVYSAERQYQLEPADERTPESLYERRWALTLLDRVLTELETEYVERGKVDLFSRCRLFLTGSSPSTTCAAIGESLDMTENAVKVAVHRLRKRYRELLQSEVAQTIDEGTTVEDELNRLLAALRS